MIEQFSNHSGEAATARHLKVIFCPYDDRNHYQRALAAQLELLGAEVEPMPAPALYSLRGRKAFGADVLHIHWLHNFLVGATPSRAFFKSLGFIAQIAFRRLIGQRIVWTAHNLLDHERRFPTMQLFFTRLFVRMAQRIFVHSHAAANLVAAHFGVPPSKFRVVPHANYVGLYPDDVDRHTARGALGVPQDPFMFLFIGNLRGYKGTCEAIEAFQRLGQENALLVFAGRPWDDQVDRQMRTWIADQPHIIYRPGFVADAELQNYFRAADVVLLPFQDILTSGSMILSMSFAKPLILPDIPVLRESAPASGVIFYAANDDDSLAGAMERAIHQQPELADMGKLCRTFVENWGWKEMAKETMDSYQELFNTKPAQRA
jgi:glycosyltransferase involved in cell wall biosynthesis